LWLPLFSVFFSGASVFSFLIFKSVHAVAMSLGERPDLRDGLEFSLRLSAWHPLLAVVAMCLGGVAVFRRGGVAALLALVLGIAVGAVPLSVL
jgi:hypothetical protein